MKKKRRSASPACSSAKWPFGVLSLSSNHPRHALPHQARIKTSGVGDGGQKKKNCSTQLEMAILRSPLSHLAIFHTPAAA